MKQVAPSSMHSNVVLVGNKCDLDGEKRKVAYAKGQALAEKNSWVFFETSALNNTKVSEAVHAAVRAALRNVSPLLFQTQLLQVRPHSFFTLFECCCSKPFRTC